MYLGTAFVIKARKIRDRKDNGEKSGDNNVTNFFKSIKPDISKELEGNISNFGSRLVTIKIYKESLKNVPNV